MNTKMNIPITKLCLGEEEVAAIREVLESGWLVQGDKVTRFEELVGGMVGTKHALACTSCTTALHMALLALHVGKGDKVVVPAYTFVASPNAVEYVGGEVVFEDIDLDTFNIDTKALWDIDRARAVMPVHLFGLCANMTEVMSWAKSKRAFVVEDAACALGAGCLDGEAGGIGDAGCFSFHPRKSVTTGEGGMVTTNRDDVAGAVHALRDFGFTITDIERHKSGQTMLPQVEMLGYNYRMTNMQGAMGVVQMKKYGYIVGERMRRAEIYNQELAGLNWVRTPVVPEGYRHTYQSYCLLVGGDDYRRAKNTAKHLFAESYINRWGMVKDRLMAELKDKGISARGGTHACHTLKYYAKRYNLRLMDFPGTAIADALLVTIPLYASMTDEEQQYVIDAIKGLKA